MKKWGVRAVLFIVAAHAGLTLAGAFLLAHPNMFKVFKDYGLPGDHGLSAETIHTKAGEAWLIRNPDSSRVILLCHGRSRNRSYMLPLARALAGDFNVALFDFRSHGQHPFGLCTIGPKESEDVGHMLDALEREGFSDIVVYGTSMGGAAAVFELAAHPRASVSGLILNGVFADLRELLLQKLCGSIAIPPYLSGLIIRLGGAWAGFVPEEVRPGHAIKDIALPVLALQARDDKLVPESSGQTLAANAGGPSRLCMYSGGHDMAGSEAVERMTRAFAKTLALKCLDEIEGR
jgi:pimeloyl-ACP methyl ester carboxylesterase